MGLYRKGAGGLQADWAPENMRPAPVPQAVPGPAGAVPRGAGGGARDHRPADQLSETALRVAYSAISPIISSVSVA